MKSDYVPAAVLSPSQANQFIQCQAAWAFRYVDRLRPVQTAAQAQGKAVHEVLADNLRQKIETGTDYPIEEVAALYALSWDYHAEQSEFREDEDKRTMGAQGAALVERYMEEIMPAIQPAAVEHKVTGEIGRVKVTGFIDVLDVHGTVIDLKNVAKTSKGISQEQRFQLATYALLEPGANGTGRIDQLVKLKTPKVIQGEPFTVGMEDKRFVTNQYAIIQGAMRSAMDTGNFIPNRGNFLCSRAQCSWWRECEERWGGTVKRGKADAE
jgi:RecB family exonuclease